MQNCFKALQGETDRKNALLSSLQWHPGMPVLSDMPVLSGLERRVLPGATGPPPCLTTSPFRTASFLFSSNVPSLNYSGLGHWLGPWQMPTCFPGQGCNLDDPSQCGGPALPSPIALNSLVGSGMPRTQASSFPPVPILPHTAAQTLGTL